MTEEKPPAASPEPTGPRRPSGLRNPRAASRGVGSAALAALGVVLLLAVQPLRVIAGVSWPAITALLILAAACFGLIGLLSRAWAWRLGWLPPVALVVAGVLIHPSLAVLGGLFGLLWLYVLHVRRTVGG